MFNNGSSIQDVLCEFTPVPSMNNSSHSSNTSASGVIVAASSVDFNEIEGLTTVVCYSPTTLSNLGNFERNGIARIQTRISDNDGSDFSSCAGTVLVYFPLPGPFSVLPVSRLSVYSLVFIVFCFGSPSSHWIFGVRGPEVLHKFMGTRY